MKKTIVKVLAIVFVVSILVSSMFVMTGASCGGTTTMKINFYDAGNFNETGFVLIGYTYNSAKSRLEVSRITINSWNSIGDSTDYFKKHVATSDLKYNKKEKCFEKTLIAMSSSENIKDAGETAFLRSCYATVKVYTGSNRAPKKGDRVYISVSDTLGGFQTTSTIASIEIN